MKVMRLENEQFALEIPLQAEYIKIKKLESQEEVVDKETITAITEDMYIEWEKEVEVSFAIRKYGDSTNLTYMLHRCCEEGIYTTEDILNYQKLVEQQSAIREVEPNKKYYDSRIVDDGVKQDFVLPRLIVHDSNDSQIPQKDGKFPFWIELHSLDVRLDRISGKQITPIIAFHICLCVDTNKIPGENLYFILDSNSKYIILKACQILAVLGNCSKNSVQEMFKICLDEFAIAQAFGLARDECNIHQIENRIHYFIRPKGYDDKVIIKKFPKDIEDFNIFNRYMLTFTNCIFEFGDKKDSLRLTGLFQRPIEFNICIFRVDVYMNAHFEERIYFIDSVFESLATFFGTFRGGANFQSATFKKRVSFCETSFGIKPTNNNNEQSDKLNLSFCGATFEVDADFKDTHFCRRVDFSNAIFKQQALFENAIFKQQALFEKTTFSNYTSFNDAKFLAEVGFWDTHFEKRVFFTESHFHKKAIFSNVVFDHNAYFNQVKFEEEVYFSQAEFYKNAHFYGTEFEEFPNFIQVIFNENVNFVNTKSNIKFEKAKEQIERLHLERKISYENQAEEDRGDKEEPKEYKIANEFRDSFRNIKSALIEHHSMLDASNYHRVELYCKELELEYKREEKAKTFCEKFKFILSNGKDFVDEIQLCCYRLTSDHHTNLLLILNNVLILIAMFGIANLVLDALNQNGEAFICIAFLIISILLMIFRTTFTAQKNFRRCLIIIKRRKKKIFLLLTCLIRCCAVVGAYVMTIYTIFTTPSSILPILGKLIENKSAEVCLFVVGNVKLLCYGGNSFASETLNLIYMLFLFLLLWSLQKTARKNTIVPS